MGLGRALGALTKRGFNASKLKATAGLAVSRSAVLKNQRQARATIARSDVVQLLKMGSHETALIRVEQVMREQNLLDALVLLENYCHLVIERAILIEQEKFCPDELKEAVSSLIFASARFGDFPELLHIRAIFAARYGKDFVARAVDLRNNCGVNPRIVQLLSTRIPSLENRVKALKKIAAEENIDLPAETLPETAVNLGNQHKTNAGEEKGGDQRARRTYKDVADAAQEAFESAAYAAAAARAALELSRGGAADPGGPRIGLKT